MLDSCYPLLGLVEFPPRRRKLSVRPRISLIGIASRGPPRSLMTATLRSQPSYSPLFRGAAGPRHSYVTFGEWGLGILHPMRQSRSALTRPEVGKDWRRPSVLRPRYSNSARTGWAPDTIGPISGQSSSCIVLTTIIVWPRSRSARYRIFDEFRRDPLRGSNFGGF